MCDFYEHGDERYSDMLELVFDKKDAFKLGDKSWRTAWAKSLLVMNNKHFRNAKEASSPVNTKLPSIESGSSNLVSSMRSVQDKKISRKPLQTTIHSNFKPNVTALHAVEHLPRSRQGS